MKKILEWLERPCTWINKAASKWWSEAIWFIVSAVICGAAVSYLLTGLVLGANWWDLLTAFGTIGATVFAAVGVYGARKAENERKDYEAHIEEVELQKISSYLQSWDRYVCEAHHVVESFLDGFVDADHPPLGEWENCVKVFECVQKIPDLPPSFELQARVSRDMASEIRNLENGINTLKAMLPKFVLNKAMDGGIGKNVWRVKIIVSQIDSIQRALAKLSFNRQVSRASSEIFSDRAQERLNA